MPRDRTPEPSSDEELVRRAQEGCVAGFEELARRFQTPLMQFLARWATREDAEDLFQETMLRAYRNLHRYRPRWRFATWLFTIARRLSINHQRRKRPRAEGELIEAVEDDRPTPASQVADAESRGRLWQLAAEVLTESQWTALWLYYVEDMSVRQIAHVLGRSQVAAKATLFRARKKLLGALEPDGSAKVEGRAMPPHSFRAVVELNDG